MDAIDRNRVLRLLTRSKAEVRLHAGEMTAQEMRSVQAILGWMRSEVERLPSVGPDTTPPPR